LGEFILRRAERQRWLVAVILRRAERQRWLVAVILRRAERQRSTPIGSLSSQGSSRSAQRSGLPIWRLSYMLANPGTRTSSGKTPLQTHFISTSMLRLAPRAFVRPGVFRLGATKVGDYSPRGRAP
jgi:hypothetical protein